jgi:signal transduction histidine kinase
MRLQAKLTMSVVLLTALTVTLLAVLDLLNDMQRQFEATLKSAELLQRVAAKMAIQTVNGQPTASWEEAWRDPTLAADLLGIMALSHPVFEIAVVDHNNVILADGDPTLVGKMSTQYPDFSQLMKSSGVRDKLRLMWDKLRLLLGERKYYQLEEHLGSAGAAQFDVDVRVTIDPALIRNDIVPTMKKDANLALLLVIGSVFLTLVFSAVAFRPLGQVAKMLDLVTQGEYEPEKLAEGPASEELAVVASKVSLLGQRLRGAEDEVSDLRGNIDRLLQDLEDAVLIFNRDHRLIFASGSVRKFLGRERSELAGETIDSVFPTTTPMGLLIEHVAENGRPLRSRRVPMDPAADPALPAVLLSVDPLDAALGNSNARSGLLVRLRDPEAQRKIGRELQTADRQAAINRITGGVAHEVKNPLNAILLHVEVARAKIAKGDTSVAPEMEIVAREILRLDRVVKTFLDFTRPVELNFVSVPLEGLLNEIVDLARPQAAASRIRVALNQAAEGVDVRVDCDFFKRAVLNVAVNAIQAMPEGGNLRFESSAGADSAEIRISDTGSGIPPELRDKIFRLYFTTKKEGSGIGLAMAFRIVQLHDGTIDFTSEPGKGTTFRIRLPIAV